MPADSPEDVIDVALRVASAIIGVGAEYFIGGSVASSLQGEPRSTNDIDIVVKMGIRQILGFKNALGSDFEVDEGMLRDALQRSTSANIYYLPQVTKIDIFGLGSTEFDQTEFSRRAAIKVRESGETLVIKSVEDTVVRKLIWYREGGGVSDKQWRDIVSVLRINQDRIDLAYVNEWSKRLSLDDLLNRAVIDSGLQL